MQIDMLALSVIVTVVVLLVAYFSHRYGRGITIEQIAKVVEVVNVAVKQANTISAMTNAQRYNYVSELATNTAKDYGIIIPPEIIRMIIEGAVDIAKRRDVDQAG